MWHGNLENTNKTILALINCMKFKGRTKSGPHNQCLAGERMDWREATLESKRLQQLGQNSYTLQPLMATRHSPIQLCWWLHWRLHAGQSASRTWWVDFLVTASQTSKQLQNRCYIFSVRWPGLLFKIRLLDILRPAAWPSQSFPGSRPYQLRAFSRMGVAGCNDWTQRRVLSMLSWRALLRRAFLYIC